METFIFGCGRVDRLHDVFVVPVHVSRWLVLALVEQVAHFTVRSLCSVWYVCCSVLVHVCQAHCSVLVHVCHVRCSVLIHVCQIRCSALIKRGSLIMQTGKEAEALNDFAAAVREDQDNSDIYHHRGQVRPGGLGVSLCASMFALLFSLSS